MKLRQEHVSTLKHKTADLVQETNKLHEAINGWLEVQGHREKYGNVDQDFAQQRREKLEVRLDRYRDKLGEIYDFMSEKGMRDIEQAGT